MLLAAGANIGVLCVLKYTGFLFSSLNQAMEALGLAGSLPGVSFLLPLGISFYTLQSVGYVIDVYRGGAKRIQTLRNIFSLFPSFHRLCRDLFPDMTSWPISSMKDTALIITESPWERS